MKKRFVRKDGGTGFIENEGSRFPDGLETQDTNGTSGMNGSGPLSLGQLKDRAGVQEAEEEYTTGEVKAGTLVLIHGNLLHKSERNTSGKSRFIYTFHVIEGDNKYDERNWLQPSSEGFSRLYI